MKRDASDKCVGIIRPLPFQGVWLQWGLSAHRDARKTEEDGVNEFLYRKKYSINTLSCLQWVIPWTISLPSCLKLGTFTCSLIFTAHRFPWPVRVLARWTEIRERTHIST